MTEWPFATVCLFPFSLYICSLFIVFNKNARHKTVDARCWSADLARHPRLIFSGPLSVFVRRKFQFKPKSVKRFYVRSQMQSTLLPSPEFYPMETQGRARRWKTFSFAWCLVLTPSVSLNSLHQKCAKSWEQGDGKGRRRRSGRWMRNAWMASKTATTFNI